MPCLDQLRSLLDSRHDLRIALEQAIEKADFPDIGDLSQFFSFLEKILTTIPVSREMEKETQKYHYIANCSPDNFLQKDDTFQQWLVSFANDYGSFLDTIESARGLKTFTDNPSYHIEDYYPGPSGWMTFNQFFARSTKPGRRPIASPADDSIVVAATDSVYLGSWPIEDGAKLTIKGTSWLISDLLGDSIYLEYFIGGTFTHSYLDVTDYHRYHLPVSGVIKEVRSIPGRVIVKMEKRRKGDFLTKDEIGFQFKQTRGMVIIDSPLGYVAAIPVGMGHVSSVVLTVEVNDALKKGAEIGYFCYGGSDMILLFQKDKIRMTAQPGVHYRQGEEIGRAVESRP